MDFQTLKVIADRGDDKTAIRDVMHFTYFEQEEKARSFADTVIEKGFREVELSRSGSDEVDESFVVIAHHDGTLIESDIGERLTTIRNVAKSFSGNYDGWETALVYK